MRRFPRRLLAASLSCLCFFPMTGRIAVASESPTFSHDSLWASDSPVLERFAQAATDAVQAPETDAPASVQASGPSPGVAAGLAVVPGVLVHGSGHFYAGRPVTGTILLLAEAAGVYLAYRGAMDVFNVVDTVDFETLNNYEGTGALSRGVGMAAGGLMLFLGTWFYDMSGAPTAAAETAQARARTQPVTAVKPTVGPSGFAVVIERKF